MNTTSTMKNLLQSIRRWLPTMQSQHERDESYLSEAVDIYDLERRMREIDTRSRNQPALLGLGLR